MFENIPTGYFYEDLLLRPCGSEVMSRMDVNMSTELLPGIVLKAPIISSPMSSITESKMAIKMHEVGGLGILHRFASLTHLEQEMKIIGKEVPKSHRAFAVGIKEADTALLRLLTPHADIICVDVNVGHHVKTIEMIKYIRHAYPDHQVIAGSVSTAEGTTDLCKAGAHCIRATNGGGSMCTTLIETGVGVPTATSLAECVQAADQYGVTVIADGGITGSGTIVKALAIGADAAMTGSLLSGSSAIPTEAFFLDEDGNYKAHYYGMASREAQLRRGDEVREGTAPEGISRSVPVRGKTSVILERLINGIRSGMSQVNAKDLSALRANAQWVKVNKWPNSFSGKMK